MQPDSISPAARIANFTFSDDIVHFQSKAVRSRRKYCAPKRHDSIKRIIVEIGNNSRP
jgi:hypothetical protein